MHRVPISMAVIILVILIFLAIGGDGDGYKIDQERIWTIIGINFILIVVAVVKRSYKKRQEREYYNSFIAEQKNKLMFERKDSESLFTSAKVSLETAKSKEDLENALYKIMGLANQGFYPAIEFLNQYTENYNSENQNNIM